LSAENAAYDVTGRKDVDLLHAKAVGLIGVLFLTITASAPISAMLFNVPLAVGFGNGIGAPATFVVATVVLLIFSVGYAAMARKVTAAGGFYSFISHGLGRELGMAMAFGAGFAYSLGEAILCGGFAYFCNLKIAELTGADVPWPYLALAMVALISILTYFDVKLSAWVLGVALVGEILVLTIFDVGVFTGSAAHVQAAAIYPVNAFKGFAAPAGLAAGTFSIGLFFAFVSFTGFEMAPNYGEESRDPKRIVPLSLYIGVLALGFFYTVTSWAGLSAYPTIDEAIKVSQTDSAHFFLTPAKVFVGAWAASLMSYLILTGSFACGMAFHNTAARYFYSLGREHVFPVRLGQTHALYRSPYVASFTQSAIAAIVVILVWIFAGGNDPYQQAYVVLYGVVAVLATMQILIAQAIVSVAIISYFRRHHPDDHHWWRTQAAPLIAFLLQIYVIGVLISQMDFFGGGLAFANWIVWINLAVLVAGIGGALYLKYKDPAKYDQIGRLVYQGIADGTLAGPERAEAPAGRS
jgi:amino acid transporter